MNTRTMFAALFILLALTVSGCTYLNNSMMDNTQNQNVLRSENDEFEILDKGQVKGGVLHVFSTYPDTLNPITTKNRYVKVFLGLLFESMVKIDRNYRPVPVLAEKWEVSADGLTWIFKMRQDVFWHDDIPFTADDVIFTLEIISNPQIPTIYKKNIDKVVMFDMVDKYTIKIILSQPDSFLPEKMTFPIIPRHCYSGENMANSSKNLKPLGTGPYRFNQYNEKKNIKLMINQKWWSKENKVHPELSFPLINEVVISLYTNGNDALNALQTGDVDFCLADTSEWDKYSIRPDLKVKRFIGNRFEFLAFNLTKKPFTEKVLRQAIARGINKYQFINEYLPGRAIPADIPISPDSWLLDPSDKDFTYDGGKCQKILGDNGWKRTEWGWYKTVDGVYCQTDFELLVNEDNLMRVKIAKRIAEQLGQLGIHLAVKKVSWEEEMKLIAQRKFDMVLSGWSLSDVQDLSFAYASREIYSGSNIAGYSNPAVDEKLNKILVEIDSERKKTLYGELKAIILEDVPYYGLFFENNSIIFSRRVRGEVAPDENNIFNDLVKWYLPN